MPINRDQFAADVYLRLLDSIPNRDQEWLRGEAIRQADEFIAELEKQKPPKVKQRRPPVNV